MEHQSADIRPTVICFVRHKTNQALQATENYLKKRNFQVYMFSDIESAIEQIEKLQPQYVFLDWDYPSDRIYLLPKTIHQFCLATIIPFTNSNAKDSIQRVEKSGHDYKIYPPISGPAVQRVIARHEKSLKEKDNEIDHKNTSSKSSKSSNADDKITIKSREQNTNHDVTKLQNKKNPIVFTENKKKIGQGGKFFFNPQEYSRTQREKIKNYHDKGHRSDHKSAWTSLPNRQLTTQQQKKLHQIFNEQIQSEISGQILTALGQKKELDQTISPTLDTIYLMIIELETWSGYLTLSLNSSWAEVLDENQIRHTLEDWIRDSLLRDRPSQSPVENEEPFLLFKVEVPHESFLKMSQRMSDYRDSIYIQNQTVQVAFFGFSPLTILNTLHPHLNFIEIPIEMIKPEIPLPFQLHLYLEKNQKMILYKKIEDYLTKEQHQRLVQSSQKLVYSPTDYAIESMKYKATRILESLIDKHQAELGHSASANPALAKT